MATSGDHTWPPPGTFPWPRTAAPIGSTRLKEDTARMISTPAPDPRSDEATHVPRLTVSVADAAKMLGIGRGTA